MTDEQLHLLKQIAILHKEIEEAVEEENKLLDALYSTIK